MAYPGRSPTKCNEGNDIQMNVISLRRIREFVKEHPDSKSSLTAWYKIARKARWRSLVAVQQVYPHADLVGKYTVLISEEITIG